MGKAMLTNFTCLAARKMELADLESTIYAASVQKLRDEFTCRSTEFRRDEIRIKLFADPIDLAVLTIAK